MAHISYKVLNAFSDLLSMEENLVAKYKQFAFEATDYVVKNQYEQFAQRHQRHFDELFSNLK